MKNIEKNINHMAGRWALLYLSGLWALLIIAGLVTYPQIVYDFLSKETSATLTTLAVSFAFAYLLGRSMKFFQEIVLKRTMLALDAKRVVTGKRMSKLKKDLIKKRIGEDLIRGKCTFTLDWKNVPVVQYGDAARIEEALSSAIADIEEKSDNLIYSSLLNKSLNELRADIRGYKYGDSEDATGETCRQLIQKILDELERLIDEFRKNSDLELKNLKSQWMNAESLRGRNYPALQVKKRCKEE